MLPQERVPLAGAISSRTAGETGVTSLDGPCHIACQAAVLVMAAALVVPALGEFLIVAAGIVLAVGGGAAPTSHSAWPASLVPPLWC